jgi:hypothetical protein
VTCLVVLAPLCCSPAALAVPDPLHVLLLFVHIVAWLGFLASCWRLGWSEAWFPSLHASPLDVTILMLHVSSLYLPVFFVT